MQVLVGIVLVTVLIAVSRSGYRLIAPDHVDGDAYDNLLQIRDMKRAGHRRPDSPSEVVTSGEYAYPHFVLWMLSFLPTRALMLVERFFSPLNDLLLVGLVLGLVPLDVLTPEQALVALVILLCTPQLVRPDLPSGVGLSQRKPGLVLTTASLLSFSLWIGGGDVAFLVAAVCLGGFMMVTSKFSLQAFAFVCVGLTIAVTPAAIGLLCGSLLFAILVSRGDYLRILRGHILHLHDFATTKQYKRFEHRFPNPVTWTAELLRARSVDDLFELVYESRWIMAMLNTPFVIVLFGAYILAAYRGVNLGFGVGTAYHVWAVTTVVCFVLISLPHLLFAGLAERYLQYGLLPALLLIVNAWSMMPAAVGVLIIGACAIGAVTELVYLWSFRRVFFPVERDRAIDGVVSALREEDPGTVLFQPAFIAREIAWRTEHDIVERLGGNSQSTDRASAEINRLFPKTYDFVTDETEWLAATYDPTLVVFDLEKLIEASTTGDVADAPGLTVPDAEPKYRNEFFTIYKFEDIHSES